jgi:hypothetical protein
VTLIKAQRLGPAEVSTSSSYETRTPSSPRVSVTPVAFIAIRKKRDRARHHPGGRW